MCRMRILIVGASGHLGRKLVQRLRQEGDLDIVAVSRSDGIDVLDPPSLERLPGRFDVVVDNVSAYRAGGVPRRGHRRIETEGHRNLAAFAARHGARAVLIGVIGSDAVDASVPHFFEKRLAEQAYEAAGVRLTSIRPGMFLDQEDGRLERGFHKGVYQHVGPTDVKFAVAETSAVADALLEAVRHAPARSVDIRNVVLADVTARELAAQMSRTHGHPIRVRAVPLWLVSVLTFVPRLFSPGLRNLTAMLAFIASGRFVSRAASRGA